VPATSTIRFDADYYARYYGARRTRVHSAREIARLATGVTALCDWWRIELKTVLDVGAGVGLWRDWFARHRPKVRYRSTEISSYACERYGHERRDIARWRAREKFDLVVCQGVLPYLDDADASAAIDNLGAMSRGLMYFEAITRSDVRDVLDTDLSDGSMHARSGRWYRARLSRCFHQVGAGLWCSRSSPQLFYELERPVR
jgi:2-polyprenyl-3-methyl-5-hydroxy-6-metoxy-1,4-benzoquinol methylase